MKRNKYIITALVISFALNNAVFAQTKAREVYGYRHFSLTYKNLPVDILVKSKKGEEQLKKPLFFFCQGSLPVTLKKFVVAGHSEGAAIAAEMALNDKRVTQLIYSGGNPLGRVMSIVSRARADESDTTSEAENTFTWWENVISHTPVEKDKDYNSFITTNSFSGSVIEKFKRINIPVLISYGSKDYRAVGANDYLRFEMIKNKKKNFTFQCYLGKEHNYFSFLNNRKVNYDDYNWDKVVTNWKNGWRLLQKRISKEPV